MRQSINHLTVLLVLTMLFPTTCGMEINAQQTPETNQVELEQPVENSASPGIPGSLQVVISITMLSLLALLIWKMCKTRPNGKSRGIDEIKPRVLIGGMLAVMLLSGFFVSLHHLLGMLPRNDADAEGIPGEYWLFIGQALGILGSLALNVATYYFGSSSAGEDEPRP